MDSRMIDFAAEKRQWRLLDVVDYKL